MKLEELKEFDIVITTNDIKKKILFKASKQKILLPYKIMSLDELKRKYYFDYDEQTIYFVMNYYHIKYEIAKMYIDNLYYINNYNGTNNKIIFLQDLKKQLEKEKLLIISPWYKDYLENSHIVFYNMTKLSKLDYNLINNLDGIIINDGELINKNNKIYEFDNIEEEVSFVVTEISKLIKKGISLDHIFINSISDEYVIVLNRYFKMFNIPVNLKSRSSIYATNIVTTFMDNYDSDIKITLSKVEELVTDQLSSNIYNKLVNICNKYCWCNDYKLVQDMIIYDLKHTMIESDIIGVNEVDLLDNIFDETDYVFLLGFEQGVVPHLYKDEDYLSDKEKDNTLFDTSSEINKELKKYWINKIKSIVNLTITHKRKSLQDTYYLSHLNDFLNYEVVKTINTDYHHSNLHNKLLLAKKWDSYLDNGLISQDFINLKHHYNDINYRIYNNQYTGIDNNKLKEYLNGKLNLSYSSIDHFYRCRFRFYLNSILKIQSYEESFAQLIGNLFHYLLSICDKPDFDFNLEWEQFIKDRSFSCKEQFFLNKLKKELHFIIDNHKANIWKISLSKKLYENKVEVPCNIDDWNINFVGIIDKIYYEYSHDGVVTSIVDYKTGNTSIHLNYLPYGIGMQLPIYLFLVNCIPDWDHVKTAGFYLQELLSSPINYKRGLSYKQQKQDQLLLKGYSNTDYSILSMFDKTYMDSTLIKSMKVNDKGFYHYSKVLSNSEMDKIIKMVWNNIIDACHGIVAADFMINPKMIDNENIGCEYCPFKDICYHKEEDYIQLTDIKDLSFLEEVSNA